MKPARFKQRALCIWLPNWPVQRLRHARPELKRRALVLYEEYRRGCFRVVSCSHQAAQQGIRPGMPLAEATALAGIHTELSDPSADRQALERLAERCESFSPVVGLEDATHPENLLFNVTGLAPLFGSEGSLAERVERAFQRQGYAVRVAIADTVGTAWAVTHYADRPPLVVPPEKSLSAIATLPIEALRLPASISTVLRELGVQRIEQLLALPRSSLAARFDAQLLSRIDQATGEVPETITAHRPPPEIEVESILEFPTDRRDAVDFLIAGLVEQVTAKLSARQQGAIRLECDLRCEAGEPLRLQIGLFRATAVTRHLLELIRMQLERAKLPARIMAVRLSVLITAPLQSQQQELFDEQPCQDDQRQWGLLVDRLSSRLGREAVLRAVPLADAQPEYAYRYEPLAGTKPRRAKERTSAQPSHRPLRLESQPVAVEVLSVVPHGPPRQFQWQGQQHRITHAWGPERIQTGWWRGRYIRRDYYRIESADGRRFWVFRRLSDGKWFLHGVFD